MKADYFEVHAFTERLFHGNPAGVCLLEEWWPDEVLQRVATENNLPETAFVVARGEGFDLRWFTPTIEVDLCGHATLAAAHVLIRHRQSAPTVRFSSRSGELVVREEAPSLVLDFPVQKTEQAPTPDALTKGLGQTPVEVWRSRRDYLAVLPSEADVRALHPDLSALRELDCLGIIATAPGDEVDFVSRFFAPRAGIDEDPVTGSAHCTLAPYWAERLGRTRLKARQISPRGGELFCDWQGDRVLIGGQAVTYVEGTIYSASPGK